ncbi:hypothetical protein FGF1_38880 [Flavobacteriaceae bacterium GF1]
MQIQTIVLMLIAFLVALGIVVFHYRKYTGGATKKILLIALRFVMLFSGFLLLINPEFTKNGYHLEKSNLVLLVDGSSSISNLGQSGRVRDLVNQFSQDEGLQEKFSIRQYAFSKEVKPLDSLDFTGKRTDISNGLATLKETFASGNNAVILVSDGNQTYGRDYEYLDLGNQVQLNTIVVGDTTSYQDVGVGLVNLNKYAFLDNQFPLEAQLVYSGEFTVGTTVRITMDGRVVHRESLQFSKNERSHNINILLKAQSTGIKTIEVALSALENERNVLNNVKRTTIEVIDEKTVVGIVSSFKHPDIGALKKAIESNEQRQVVIMAPNTPVERLEAIDVFVLYQPNASFRSIYDFIKQRGGGVFTITGPETDWSFLNTKLEGFTMEAFGQGEEILPFKNAAFEVFDIANFLMDGFPPLEGELGELRFNTEPSIIAYQQIRRVNLQEPLWFVLPDGNKQAFLLGANIWKWRLRTYRNEKDFSGFDELMGKLIFYLSNSGKRERLQLDFETTYENTSETLIKASFFDNTYSFDENASLNLNLKSNDGLVRDIPMLLKGNQFQADLSDLEEGEYSFTVTETMERISKSGQFTILDFDLEKQFLNANHVKLRRLAENNSGNLYYPSQVSGLITDLLNENQFLPVQKSTKNVVSLIDFSIVLGIMVFALALEWFIRKYNGLL